MPNKKQRGELQGIRHVQAIVTADTHAKLAKYAQDRSVSVNLALKAIIESTVNSKKDLPLETVLADVERTLLKRVLELYRGGDTTLRKALMGMLEVMERALAAQKYADIIEKVKSIR